MAVADEIAVVVEIGEIGARTLRILAGAVVELATRMHVFTHVRPSMLGQSGMPGNEYADGMIEHDANVGKLQGATHIEGLTSREVKIATKNHQFSPAEERLVFQPITARVRDFLLIARVSSEELRHRGSRD